jgi:hypothetical protein
MPHEVAQLAGCVLACCVLVQHVPDPTIGLHMLLQL